MQKLLVAIILGMTMAGCPAKSGKPDPADVTKVSDVNLGKTITVEGWAINRKNGAMLQGNGFELWIDDLAGWPEGYYFGGDKGRKVRVTGILAQDHGLPVFVPKEDEPVVQGIPVEEGTDLEQASLRYILKNATWEPID